MGIVNYIRSLFHSYDYGFSREPIFGSKANTLAGINVSENTAWNLSFFWSGCRVIADAVAACPIHVYRRKVRGREAADTHALYDLLRYSPHPDYTDVSWKEYLTRCILVNGNAYAIIVRNGGGVPVELQPVAPQRVQVRREGQALNYYVDGKLLGNPEEGDPSALHILHIPGLGDGIVGYSILRLAKENIGLSRAHELTEAAFFGNAARIPGVIETPPGLSENAIENMRKSWEANYSGPMNAGKAPVLEGGTTFRPVALNMKETEILGLKKYDGETWARWFNCPVHKLAKNLDRATWNNIASENLSFYTDTIRPLLIKIEAELNRKLFSKADRRTYYAEFLPDAILRADIETRYKAYQTGLSYGWLDLNTIAEMENLPAPAKGGDVRFVPQNLQTLDNALNPATAPLNTGAKPLSEDADAPRNESNSDGGTDQ